MTDNIKIFDLYLMLFSLDQCARNPHKCNFSPKIRYSMKSNDVLSLIIVKFLHRVRSTAQFVTQTCTFFTNQYPPFLPFVSDQAKFHMFMNVQVALQIQFNRSLPNRIHCFMGQHIFISCCGHPHTREIYIV